MKKLITCLFLSLLVACGASHDANVHLQWNQIRHINHGVVALVYPSSQERANLGVEDPADTDNMVTLGREHVSFCAGFFVSRTTVMTAAHCVSRRKVVRTVFGPMRIRIDQSPVGDLKKVVSYSQYMATRTKMQTYRTYVVKKYNLSQDIALLQLQEGQLPHDRINVLRIGNRSPHPGSRVYAIGHPSGQEWTLTEGIVSRPRRLLEITIFGRTLRQRVIQTSAQVYYGNSGGPLLNNRGDVIGVCSRMIEPHLGFFTHVESIRVFLHGR